MHVLNRIAIAAHAARRSLAVIAVALCAAILVAGGASAQSSPTFTPRDEAPEEFPEGPGREETFYLCTACHNFKLVAAQGLNRRQWEESFQLMIDRHGMADVGAEDRRIIIDYLEQTYPPRAPAGGGWKNPFMK